MPSRKSRVKRRNATRPVTVSVLVPEAYARVPSVLDVPATFQRQRRARHIDVPLRRARGRLIRRTFRLNVFKPRYVRPAKIAITRNGRMRLYSRRHTQRYLAREMHRPRNSEVKTRKRRLSDGHLDSIRSDRTGIVMANSRSDIRQIADAAMVARALQRY